jgi:RNA polymerase sigma-70 factor (ECF subfamily)
MSASSSSNDHDRQQAAELLAAALSGSGESLGDLLDRHRNYLVLLTTPQLVGPGRKRCSESDIVQETFLEAHRDFAAFRGTTLPQFQAWLRRILGNNILAFLERHVWAEKRDVRREQSLQTVAEGLACSAIHLESFVVGSGDSPSECAMRREDSLRIADAIASLPEDYREIIVLRTFQGLSFDEAAASMDRTAGALRMLWMRALESLRTQLDESWRND